MIARIFNALRNLHHWQWSGMVALEFTSQFGHDFDPKRFYRPELADDTPPAVIWHTQADQFFVDTGKYDDQGFRIYREGFNVYDYEPGTE